MQKEKKYKLAFVKSIINFLPFFPVYFTEQNF